jgi:uncharacterized YigZ family protein
MKSGKIVYKEGTGEIVEKKSRFIASIFPAENEEEALMYIAQIRKKHYDARHNCFAYIIGENQEIERCSDDGEPSGTAGRPMLDMLKGQDIHNVVAIVTRYFGGTLLGTGGLVRAYTAAMKEGLSACVLMEQKSGYRVSIHTDYNDLGKIQYILRTLGLTELDTVYSDNVEMVLLIPEEKIEEAERELTEKTAGKAKVERQERQHYGIADGEVVLL